MAVKKSLLGLLCSLMGSFAFHAQDNLPDSLPQHSIRKAVILSAVVPGAGQIYNHLAMPKGQKKAYWKVPLFYAGLGATGYFALKNNSLRKQYRSEYESRQAGNDPVEFTEYDDAGLLTLHATARNRRDLCIVGFGLVYLLNVVDAGIEAHFVNFDVGENLNLSFTPTYDPYRGMGVAATLKFR